MAIIRAKILMHFSFFSKVNKLLYVLLIEYTELYFGVFRTFMIFKEFYPLTQIKKSISRF